MKGTHSHSHRRRWSNAYIVMAIVCCVFGCGILGLMGIHRLKERSSFSLMIKEKDDQILSLHLLLQKERERVAETRRKAEEMRTNMASLGSQKAELSTKVSEMQSTISSLREEQRAAESAFQEKYAQMNDQSRLQVEALQEEVRRKEGEIEDLRLRLANGVGSNATVAEADAKSGGGTETEETNDTSVENEATRGKEDGADDRGSEVRGSTRRFRGKRGYLRRAKGRRWRSVGKQAQVRKSDGDSTMADAALRNSSAEQTRASLEELAEGSERKTEGGREQENEQAGDENAEDGNEHQRIDVAGRKGAAERSAEERDVRDADESEDKEETGETEF
ncbi:cyclin-dependent kinase 11B-like [Salvia hispanica]|uniref:cyclin-dependent kinase 11B-like n=1 Tax=Salvia hispanica TaxID=49212 RepID=UPI002008FB73|nr:cyclin-dependent kinase 11B-like [Salvia hispanica]